MATKNVLLIRLICEFMEIKPHLDGPDVYSWRDGVFFYCREDSPEKVMDAICEYAKYDVSWEWLMPVVHKCLGICHEKMLNEWEQGFCDAFMSCSIDKMFKEVTDFITFIKKNPH